MLLWNLQVNTDSCSKSSAVKSRICVCGLPLIYQSIRTSPILSLNSSSYMLEDIKHPIATHAKSQQASNLSISVSACKNSSYSSMHNLRYNLACSSFGTHIVCPDACMKFLTTE